MATRRRSGDDPSRRTRLLRPCLGTADDELPYKVSSDRRTDMRFKDVAKRTGRAVALSAALLAAASLTIAPTTAYAQHRGGGGGGWGGHGGGGFHGGGLHGGFHGGWGHHGWGHPGEIGRAACQ